MRVKLCNSLSLACSPNALDSQQHWLRQLSLRALRSLPARLFVVFIRGGDTQKPVCRLFRHDVTFLASRRCTCGSTNMLSVRQSVCHTRLLELLKPKDPNVL